MNKPNATAAATLTAGLASQSTQTVDATDAVNANMRAFDFIVGKWRVHNRRLAKWLQGSSEWIEFEARNEGRLLLGGLANQDEFRTDYWPNFVGMSFRFFDRDTNKWSIYWMDTRNAKLDPPVVGAFEGPIGTFMTHDVYLGTPIVVRFVWSRTNTATPRWEQAFSADGGASWETNWIMDFCRPTD